MFRGAVRNFRSWLEFAPTFSGVKTGENLNTKETHVGMNRNAVLDRSSTLLTSIYKSDGRLFLATVFRSLLSVIAQALGKNGISSESP